MEITGINIAIGGRREVDQGSIFLSFQVNIAHFGGLLQNILWRVVAFFLAIGLGHQRYGHLHGQC